MTENERKIAELNRLYSELTERHSYLQNLIRTSEDERWKLIVKIDEVRMEREVLINIEVEKYLNLK